MTHVMQQLCSAEIFFLHNPQSCNNRDLTESNFYRDKKAERGRKAPLTLFGWTWPTGLAVGSLWWRWTLQHTAKLCAGDLLPQTELLP
jgi:hypothetical protein